MSEMGYWTELENYTKQRGVCLKKFKFI
jgi:hypothetical protein